MSNYMEINVEQNPRSVLIYKIYGFREQSEQEKPPSRWRSSNLINLTNIFLIFAVSLHS